MAFESCVELCARTVGGSSRLCPRPDFEADIAVLRTKARRIALGLCESYSPSRWMGHPPAARSANFPVGEGVEHRAPVAKVRLLI